MARNRERTSSMQQLVQLYIVIAFLYFPVICVNNSKLRDPEDGYKQNHLNFRYEFKREGKSSSHSRYVENCQMASEQCVCASLHKQSLQLFHPCLGAGLASSHCILHVYTCSSFCIHICVLSYQLSMMINNSYEARVILNEPNFRINIKIFYENIEWCSNSFNLLSYTEDSAVNILSRKRVSCKGKIKNKTNKQTLGKNYF